MYKNLIKFSLLLCFMVLMISTLCVAQTVGGTANSQEKPQAAKPGDDKKPAEAKPASAPEIPADRKALTEIGKITDPHKKLEAFEKFLVDFPKSSAVSTVNGQILDLLVKNFPNQKDRILAQAKKILDAAPEGNNKSRTYVSVATTLANAGVLLDQAEEYAQKGVRVLDEKRYIQDQKDASAKRKKQMEEAAAKRAAENKTGTAAAPEAPKMKEPTDEEYSKQFQKMLAGANATLGQVFLKQGKYDEAAKILKKAYDVDPTLAPAATGLGELAARDGKYDEAVNYYASVALTGRMPAAARKQFEDAYAKSHKGTLDGLEEMLDARYKKEFPLPLTVQKYKASAARSKRVVLGEVFTGSGCPPCVGADLAFEGEMERFRTSELAVIMYHLHIPAPDPISSPSTQTRAKFYKVNAVPSMFIDGEADGKGGGSRDGSKNVYDRINPKIEKRMEAPPQARVKLRAKRKGSTVAVKVKVDKIQSDSKNLKLQIALVEKQLRYSGENGIRFHPMVVRYMAGPDALSFPVDAKKGAAVQYAFDIPKIIAEAKAHLDDYEVNGRHGKITFSKKMHEIDSKDLAVVAFVQDETSKGILQSIYLDVK
jgi:tetratricopeptide (TPR) repeat protein